MLAQFLDRHALRNVSILGGGCYRLCHSHGGTGFGSLHKPACIARASSSAKAHLSRSSSDCSRACRLKCQARPEVIGARPALRVFGQGSARQSGETTQTVPINRPHRSAFCQFTVTSCPATRSDMRSVARLPNGWPRSGASIPSTRSVCAFGLGERLRNCRSRNSPT